MKVKCKKFFRISKNIRKRYAQKNYKIRSKRLNHRKPLKKLIPKMTEILDINDDCILEIMERLPFEDLERIKMVCKRFHVLSTQVLRRMYVNTANHLFTFNIFEDNNCIVTNAMEAITSCGAYIQKMEIKNAVHSDLHLDFSYSNTLKLFDKYCGNKLLELSLAYFCVNRTLLDHFNGLFNNVEVLKLIQCDISLDERYLLLDKCKNLRMLVIDHHGDKWIQRRYQNLRNIKIIRSNIDTSQIESFYLLNGRLIENAWFDGYTRRILNHPESDVPDLIEKNAILTDKPNINFGEDYRFLFVAGIEFGEDLCKSIEMKTDYHAELKWFACLSIILSTDVCRAIGKLDTMQILKILNPVHMCNDFVDILSSKLVCVETVYLSGCLFHSQHILDFVDKFPKLKSLCLYKTAFDQITKDNINALINCRQRNEKNNRLLTIYVCTHDTATIEHIKNTFQLNNYIKLVFINSFYSFEFNSQFIMYD